MIHKIIDSAIAGRKAVWFKECPDKLRNDLTELLPTARWNERSKTLFFDESDLEKVEAYLAAYEQPQKDEAPKVWAIVELFGHQVIAGAISKVEPFGSPMVQIDVPATELQPAFSKQFNPTAIYGITYVTEAVAVSAAQEARAKPVKVYVPAIDDITNLLEENKMLKRQTMRGRHFLEDRNDETQDFDSDHA